jgi:plasmid stability protein
MAHLFIRNVDAQAHRDARRRAQAEGRSLKAIVEAAFRAYAAGQWTPPEVVPARQVSRKYAKTQVV